MRRMQLTGKTFGCCKVVGPLLDKETGKEASDERDHSLWRLKCNLCGRKFVLPWNSMWHETIHDDRCGLSCYYDSRHKK